MKAIISDSGLIALRDAIIERAVKDWKLLCRRKNASFSDFYELIGFFKNDCYGLLEDLQLDGRYILNELCKIEGAPDRKEIS